MRSRVRIHGWIVLISFCESKGLPMRQRIGRPLLMTDMESELRLDNARREENEQLLLGHCLRLILEQPAQHRHSG